MKFTLEQEFSVSPEILFLAWLTSKTHTEMTGGECIIHPSENTDFEAWDGYITGKNIELKPYTYIKQSWRTTEFSNNQKDSILEIKFEKVKENYCKLILTHSNLSDEDQQYKQGWVDHYFTPMLEYFAV